MSIPTVSPPSSSGSDLDPSSSHSASRPSKRPRFSVSPPPTVDADEVKEDGKEVEVGGGDLKRKLNYRGGMFLAPMVRIGTLTTRLLALEYGADLVWGPEIVDKAIINAHRIVDPLTGTIEYQKSGPKPIWTTHPIEKSRLIYQIGSADKELALQAARTVMNDVSGIDLNCGCPKSFSTSGGMGAALLAHPEKLCGILRHLVDNLPSMLISCKIRLLPSQEDTLSLVSQIVATGISCLTVHCRTQTMRSSEPALLHRLREVVEKVDELTQGRVPVVANGDCWTYDDVERIKALTGVTSVMSARGAEANVSCFRKEGKLDPTTEVIPLFVKVGLATGQAFGLAKYCLTTMDLKGEATGNKHSRKSFKNQIHQCKNWEDLAALGGIEDFEAAKKVAVADILPVVAGLERQAREEGKLAAGAIEVAPEPQPVQALA